jgi:hypothetical protein
MLAYKVEATRHALIWSPKEVNANSYSKAKYPLIHETGHVEKTCDILCIQKSEQCLQKIT